MEANIQLTHDGSHTIYIPEIDETYHSIHGAIQEAKHVFIHAGLSYFSDKNKINVLEVGFGTGLNAILTYLFANDNQIMIDYQGVEAFPVAEDLINNLNYSDEIQGDIKKVFLSLHEKKWGEKHQLTPYFSLKKMQSKIQALEFNQEFDVVFFDAFGPRAQAEMWEKEIFVKLFNSLNDGGILVTYCAKGSVKRTLKDVGFKVENLPGPPGKREMTRALKC